MVKRYKALFFVFAVINALFFLNNEIIAKGPHTDSAIYAEEDTDIGKDVCKACHLPHSAKGKSRLWPVGFTDTAFVDTTGVTVIQNLCMFCHRQRDLDFVDGFWVGKYKAHTLLQAHGQYGVAYETGALAGEYRYGAGHLYRHSAESAPLRDANKGDTVQTRDGDSTIQGYGAKYSAYDKNGFETMALSVEPAADYSLLSRLSCFSCHSPHADFLSGNYDDRQGSTETYDSSYARNYIKDFVGDDTTTLIPTYYDSVKADPTNSYIGRTRKVCLACHFGGEEPSPSGFYTAPAVSTKIDNIIPPIPPGRTQGKPIGAHYDGKSKCYPCHSWDWPTPNCTNCHGYPPSPAGGPGDRATGTGIDKHYSSDYYNNPKFPQFTITGVGAHDTHVIGQRYDCVVCHSTYLGETHNNDTVDVFFESSYIVTETTATSTTYVTVGVNFPGGTKIPSNDYCSVVYNGPDPEDKDIICVVACHNPVVGGLVTTKEILWYNPLNKKPIGETGEPRSVTPVLNFKMDSLYMSFPCVDCHDYETTYFTPNLSLYGNASGHPYITASLETKRNSCAICHSKHNWMYFETTAPMRWEPKSDTFNIYSDSKMHMTHANLYADPVVKAKTEGLTGYSIFEWNPMIFNTTATPNFPNPSLARYSSATTASFGFPTRFGSTGIFDIYSEGPNEVGICDPCHDTTAFEIRYGTSMVHGSSSEAVAMGTTYLRAPKAASFFYESSAGSGGHGQSTTQTSGHRMGDSRLTGGNDEQRMKCRSCHLAHGSTIPKLLDTAAVRPDDVFKPIGSLTLATGNDNSFCYRCHYSIYDNGFYSSTGFSMSIHSDSSSTSNVKIWTDTLNYIPYAPAQGDRDSYFWKPNKVTGLYTPGLCIYCHEPHGGYGWDSSVFDTPGFSSFTRGGTRGKYVDDSSYGTSESLGDQNLCYKCHSYDSTWNVYLDTLWASASYAGKVYNADDWVPKGLDLSSLFETSASGSHHRVRKDEQKPGATLPSVGNYGYSIIECINCHNPHKVMKKDTTANYSTVENLMYPFRPAEFMYDTTVTDSSREYRVYNKFCLACHNSKSESAVVYNYSNEQRGMIYRLDSAELWGKLPRGIRFSKKDKWGEGDTTNPDDTTNSILIQPNAHSWNKAAHYNEYGHGIDSTLSIGSDYETDRVPLASLGPYGMSCARINEFACHDPHGSKTNISLLRDNVKHPYDTFAVGNYNYNTPHLYDTTLDTADDAKNTDRWCAAACHKIGKRSGEMDWSHTYNYVRQGGENDPAGLFETSFGDSASRDIDLYDTFDMPNDTVGTEPILNNNADRDQDSSFTTHSSFNRVPGDGNSWPDASTMGYDTSYKLNLPAKKDVMGINRFVCFTCHDPHGTGNQGMIRNPFETGGNSGLCLRCHTP